ncbi:MFS transporter [Aureibacter tunicatorum]|uniref:Dipeptide/tripeptide permease n=1 Tax=Aureibacter tunicatorum TaxID=866807 RepID=A0AAE3XKN2_9BACT|nr:MFS transporter [Aureibacter tunicatorum]MDR6238637.1 dipeptide/tripeptide permease [Aureibacter tunicatorum]BDD05432.1 MFS transporter [Aureibacter tunicatorum]
MSKFVESVKSYPGTFWTANTMELFERWAWYGLFSVMAVYLTGSTDEGALGFSHEEKGFVMGGITFILYLLPLVSGPLSDKFGYKKTLIVSYLIMGASYLALGQFATVNSFFVGFLFVAFGAALFKPVISATVARTTSEETRSIGFGLFYMTVNIGGFIGPLVASKLREISWDYVFYMSAAAMVVNLLLIVFFYKEPEREKNNEPLLNSIGKAFYNIVLALKDLKLLFLLIIITGFWTMFNQIFYTLPNFIEQWVNTSELYNFLKENAAPLATIFGTEDGTVNPETMGSVNFGSIVIFQLLVSTFVMRFKPLYAMMGGILVCALGVGIAFYTSNPFFVLLGILIFSFGEMGSSPKFTEYIGSMAPPEKTALYMGTSYLPNAVGNLITGWLSGSYYQENSDKIELLKKEMSSKNITMPEINDDFSSNEYFNLAAEKLQMTNEQLTQYLWNTYDPAKIWLTFAAIGVATVILLFGYDILMKKLGLVKAETKKETAEVA